VSHAAAAGCFNDIAGDYGEVVDAQDAFDLDEQPVKEPEVAAGDAGDCGDGLAVGESASSRVSRAHPVPRQQTELRRMHATGDYTIADLAELFTVSRPAGYRTLQRETGSPPPAQPAGKTYLAARAASGVPSLPAMSPEQPACAVTR
jgi:hypothetical protein